MIKLNLLNDEPGEQATSLYTAGNKFWIGTEGGLIEYFPQVKNVDSTTAPVVYFTEVSINGIRDSLMQSYTLAGERRLKAGNNIISFEFAGIYHAEDAPLLYRYKLEGQDNTWTYAGERNFVSYNLPPGNYTFKVQSSVGTGEWSQQPATFGFVIPAPFWKQWWFISVIAVALISLLFLSYRYKVQQALKLERMRQRISSDLHDDIGSTLSSISILSDIASKEKDQWQSGRMMQEIK